MLETCVDPNLEPASGLDWDKMQLYQTHVKQFFDNLHGVLVQEGWASLAGEFEDSEGNGISARAQLSLLWSYRGKVDWKTFELPFTGIEPAVFLMSGVLKSIDLAAQTDNPLKKCSLWSGVGSPGMRSYWVDVNVTRLSVGLSVVEVKIKCQCWCILLRNEIGSHPIPTNPAWTMCLLRFWLGCCQWFDCHVQGVGRKLEKGPTFTPTRRAEIYRMYLGSIVSIAAWGHAQTGVEVRLQWVVEARLNELLRVLSKPNTSPAISNHTIPLHCREANFWLDASATSQGYVGFTGSHLGCILLHFKALLSYLPNLEPMLSPVSQTKAIHSWSPGAGLWHLQLPWTTPMARDPCHGVDTLPVQEWPKTNQGLTSTFLSWGKSKSHRLWRTVWFEPMFRSREFYLSLGNKLSTG